MSVAHHNAVLRKGEERARDLEEKLAAILLPVLEQAGDEAARRFAALAVDHLAASARMLAADRARVKTMGLAAARKLAKSLVLTAAIDVQSNSTMIAVKPRPDEAAALADADGYPPENLHVTLCYLGEIDGDLTAIVDALRPVAAAHPPLIGQVGGYGQFGMPDGTSVGILLPDVPGLVELRCAVAEGLYDAGIYYAREHGFEAHITVDDEPEPGELEQMLPLSGSPLHFDELLIVRGDTEIIPLPLVGVPALTAAAGDRYCLPAQLRTKTDPVRQEVIKTMMKASLEGVGLSFDVTNPLTARVLAQSASQITHISKTTQLDVMKVIHAAHEEGLSIPDTAAAIREKMREASPARARLIARTELAGAVNGGSLAATKIVSNATGQAMFKQWMTAVGAKHPRHAKYPGLGGQTRKLDDYFQVGTASLEYPGDPAGPPAEICNCRCTMGYTDNAAAITLFASAEVCPVDHGCEIPTDVDRSIASESKGLTAAGPAGWSAPAPDEILDVSCGAASTVGDTALSGLGRTEDAFGHAQEYIPWDEHPGARERLRDALLSPDPRSVHPVEREVFDGELIPTQIRLEGDKVEAIRALPQIPRGTSAAEDIIIVKLGGKFYVEEGHHRVAAMLLNARQRGSKSLLLHVYDLDAP